MHPTAILMTLAGLVPFVGLGLAAVGGHAPTADRALSLLIDYAAVMLGFSGGIYWALAVLPSSVRPGIGRLRIVSGAVPLLMGWGALILAQLVAAWAALAMLIAGTVIALGMERRAGQHESLPRHFVWMRWGFTIVAAGMLTTVLILRIFGRTIVF